MRFPFALKTTAALIGLALIALPEMLFPALADPAAGVSQESQAREKGSEKDAPDKKQAATPAVHEEVVVTATRVEAKVFDTPAPVSVINLRRLRESAPNTISDLLPEMPGMDIVGVGANQTRPVIRGLRGQRILLLSDGIRLSHSRRTQDFGEIPASADVSWTDRVEIVRGPASVLYGSDAIGGVINIIPQVPDLYRGNFGVQGSFGYRYGSADSQHKGFAHLTGGAGRLSFMLNGSYRQARDYEAPAGRFGDITLAEPARLRDSGVRDSGLNAFLGWKLPGSSLLSLKYETYGAADAGFGYVDPALYAPGDPTIRLLYPKQDIDRFIARYENRSLNFVLADGINATGYRSRNARTFDSDITVPMAPGAGARIQSRNFTDVRTTGLRIEMTKVLFRTHILTYGFDGYQDDSLNTDAETTTMFGFGPPRTSVDEIPNVPNARFRALGFFLQDQWAFLDRSSLVLGVRYQDNMARTLPTDGLNDPLMKSRDQALVGAANLIFGLSERLNLMFTAGRGFRSPNLTERFFMGVTPSMAGYQVRTPGLEPETSLNIEAGLRWKAGRFYLESSVFDNTVRDGITVVGTGQWVGRLPEYKNVNIDRLRYRGFEFMGEVETPLGLSLAANYTRLWSKNLTNPEFHLTDTYSSRLNLQVRYAAFRGRFRAEYHIRLSGSRKDIDLGVNPIGAVIPGFTVHTLRLGTVLFADSKFPQEISLVVENLSDALYSEFSNAGFFRPAPGRHAVLNWIVRF